MDFSNLIQPIALTWPLIVIAVLTAVIRAWRDNIISDGKWKNREFVLWGVIAVSLSAYHATQWWEMLFLPVIFSLWFWIVFDMACGWFRSGKIFYFGSGTFDQKMKRISRHPAVLLFYKVVFLIIIQGVYYSIQKAM